MLLFYFYFNIYSFSNFQNSYIRAYFTILKHFMLLREAYLKKNISKYLTVPTIYKVASANRFTFACGKTGHLTIKKYLKNSNCRTHKQFRRKFSQNYVDKNCYVFCNADEQLNFFSAIFQILIKVLIV